MTLTMMRKCYSVSRSPIDENNTSVSKNLIEIVAKLASAAEFGLDYNSGRG